MPEVIPGSSNFRVQIHGNIITCYSVQPHSPSAHQQIPLPSPSQSPIHIGFIDRIQLTQDPKMAAEDTAKRLEEAKKLAKEQPAKAEQHYKAILSEAPGSNDKAVRQFEEALIGLGELLRDHKRANDLANLIQQTRDVLTGFAKAKTSKLGMVA